MGLELCERQKLAGTGPVRPKSWFVESNPRPTNAQWGLRARARAAISGAAKSIGQQPYWPRQAIDQEFLSALWSISDLEAI